MNPVRQVDSINTYEVYKHEPRKEKKQNWLDLFIDAILYMVTIALFGLICLFA